MRNEGQFNPAQAPQLRLVRDDLDRNSAYCAPAVDAAPPRLAATEPRALQVVRENRLAAHAGSLHPQDIDAGDPRWVLAMQTRARLQGALLTPERRGELMRCGRDLGLRAFESNLVIAVMQDRARRPHAPVAAPRSIGLIGVRAAPVGTVPAPPAARRSPWLASLIAAVLIAAGIIAWLLTAVAEI
jgi:hypothetical protein